MMDANEYIQHNYDTTYVEHITPTVTIGDTVYTGWHQLAGFAMLGMTVPEVCYKIDTGNVQETVAQRRLAATCMVVASAESLLTYVRYADVTALHAACDPSWTEDEPGRATITLTVEDKTVYQRTFLIFPVSENVEHGIITSPEFDIEPGDLGDETEVLHRVFPNYEWSNSLFHQLTDASKMEVAAGAVAHKLMVQLLTGTVTAAVELQNFLTGNSDAIDAESTVVEALPDPDSIDMDAALAEIQWFANEGDG